MKLIVCDMAGTTIKDEGRVHRCFRRALAESGFINDKGIQTHMGRGKLTAIRALVGEERAEGCFKRFRELLEQDFEDDPAQGVEGVERFFRWAKNRGIDIALNTGFYADVTDLIIAQLGWVRDGLVGAVLCDDDVLQGRPAPYMIFKSMMVHGVHDVRDVVYVGDTLSDMMAGRNARVRVNIGVLTGSEDQLHLYKAGAHAVLESIALVPQLLP